MAKGCPNGWEPILGACYYLSNTVRTYENSEDYCREKGGHLFSPMDAEVNEDLFLAIQNNALASHATLPINSSQNQYWINSDGVSKEMPKCNFYTQKKLALA